MKRLALLVLIMVASVAVKAQTETLWKSENLAIEETTQENGERVYNLFSKELKYDEIYYLLTVSSGTMQEVYDDVVYYEKLCRRVKGEKETHKSNDIATRNENSIFVVVDGDLGFTIMEGYDLHKVAKKMKKRAEEIGEGLAL
ncbi:hypothetical protein [Reichenbachiella agariperforans]|uniref:Uncharacterized protein n=1 Tax=Reichenbachiella agariperforans TaxID=156994 RepID=A0A1M6LQ10_REIAG|nr:hypothetical protein [Reichenbachiella agariperforans]MBU2914011.1 hypothetical protein [Reichenbachiella agariperforans]SHJ73298.1 hypothetical protein SAMN04488028_1011053 [Reichenbachiella agariperforans]